MKAKDVIAITNIKNIQNILHHFKKGKGKKKLYDMILFDINVRIIKKATINISQQWLSGFYLFFFWLEK